MILVTMNLWKTVGYSMVVYLASITGIDGSLYEAAVIDGATKFQQAKYITIPSIKPIVIMMFILNIGKIFYSDFGLFYQVTQGIPNSLYKVASTFDTYIYNALNDNAFGKKEYPCATSSLSFVMEIINTRITGVTHASPRIRNIRLKIIFVIGFIRFNLLDSSFCFAISTLLTK
jgi:ABC-type polysaccharide transport system permease subunit